MAKTTSTSVRLDDKIEWALELIKRRTGILRGKAIERGALREIEILLTPDARDTHEPVIPKRFLKLWHPDEAVRHVQLLFAEVHLTYHEEDRERVLIEEHRDAWFDEEGDVIVDNANALHEHLGKLVDLRDKTRSKSAVAKAIAGYLVEAAKRGQV